MRKDKTGIIIALVAAVCIMAVGFAAFSTTLNISSSAGITSTWNVGFDTTKTSGTGVVSTSGTATGGTITYSDNQHATISSTGLVKPGDSATYTLTIKNNGTLNATLGTPTLTGHSCGVSSLTCTTTSGNIKFTVTNPVYANNATNLAASTGTATMTVKAEFVNRNLTTSTQETASIDIALTATQA